MLTHLMAQDNKAAARNHMGTIAWACCAKTTPAGYVYGILAHRVNSPKNTAQPASYESAVKMGSSRLSKSAVSVGLALTRPLFHLHGTGMSLSTKNEWHCGALTWGTIAIIDSLSRPLIGHHASHVLAAALVLGWPIREGMRGLGVACLLMLAAGGSIVGAAAGCIEYSRSLKKVVDYDAAWEAAVNADFVAGENIFFTSPPDFYKQYVSKIEEGLGRALTASEKDAASRKAEQVIQQAEQQRAVAKRERLQRIPLR